MSATSYSLNITITAEKITDFLEGHSTYSWFRHVECVGNNWEDGGILIKYDREEDEEGDCKGLTKYDRQQIIDALGRFATQHPAHFADLMTGNDDMNTMDVFLQTLVFNKLVYG